MHYLLNAIDARVAGRTEDQATFELDDGFGHVRTYANKVIYGTHPHGTADNHFSGSNVCDMAGRMGFGLTLTNRRDRFPTGLKPFFHHGKTKPGCQRAKVARYENPIVAVKQFPEEGNAKAYTRTQVSFQSTGATNIQGVNNLRSCQLYVSTKSRGQGSNKRTWGIEQNEGRQTYLGTYYAIDNVDHMISMAMIKYVTWKYWHAPMLHGLGMAVTAAYDMYSECCDGLLDPEWKVEMKDRMSNSNWRLKASEQMLKYNPAKNGYPGDTTFRAFSKRPKRMREEERRSGATVTKKSNYKPDGLTLENFKRAKRSTRLLRPRLCGDLADLREHFLSIGRSSRVGRCEVCNEPTLWRCGLCDKRMCALTKGKFKGTGCALKFHDDAFFGLTKSDDRALFGRRAGKKWLPPNASKIRSNKAKVEVIKRKIAEETEVINVV